MRINDTGFWEGDPRDFHYHDAALCSELMAVLREKHVDTVLDLGCGNGSYALSFEQMGIHTDCCDGNPLTPEITNGKCFVVDLAYAVELQKTYGCVLSLEVGEHIPKEFEQTFIDNVIRHAERLVILSWAVPDQGGQGHFNERPNTYVAERFNDYGFVRDRTVEDRLRNSATQWWFKNTIMVFTR